MAHAITPDVTVDQVNTKEMGKTDLEQVLIVNRIVAILLQRLVL